MVTVTLTSNPRATLQPRVPAPRRRHLVSLMVSRFRSGMRRQRISFRFRSTADSASLKGNRASFMHVHAHTCVHTHLAGSMVRLRLTNRGATLFCSFISHPTTFGTPTNNNNNNNNTTGHVTQSPMQQLQLEHSSQCHWWWTVSKATAYRHTHLPWESKAGRLPSAATSGLPSALPHGTGL